ncbi:hypothetical protein WJX72_007862 [[Myrmecia] bisecta]|uniref:Coatomer subunit delta n=1 Tax=[Myrmecia] bisecta TaxID=41462 RepID=A0AAW1PGP8_9CHLO
MVVLAASVVTKSGKALVSRQFVDMSRIRIEGLLAAFPKLIGTGKQHTYVETENVRYVYQPMEGLYLLLVTNKSSNILEDVETLRLLSKVVPEVVPSMDEDGIGHGAFDLIFAFDEVISLGYRDSVTAQQVKQNTEMESHEEKLHKMIIQSKINDTKDVMKRKAMEIDKNKLERAKDTRSSAYMPTTSSLSGMGGRGGFGSAASDVDSNTPTFSRPEPGFGSTFNKPAERPSKGMQLGKAKKANDFLESLRAEGEVVEVDNGHAAAASSARGPAAVVAPSEPISIVVEEKLQVALNKDGGMENMEVQGTMSLQVLLEQEAWIKVAITSGENPGYQFKTHPNIDKALYSSQNVLGLKDPERPFPSGAPLGILKWRFQTRDESMVPLSINCWPSASGGDSYVNIEYECTTDSDLQNVVVAIPLPPMSSGPKVNQCDGDYHYDPRKSLLLWSIDLIDDTNRSGAMEFVTPVTASDTFFPVEVSFTSAKTLCDVSVASVTSNQTGAPVKYAYKTLLATDGYQVV